MAGGACEAHVVGAGPNGLAAAIALAEAGWRVTVHEADDVPGGGVRSAELTLPGFVHDRCSAIHPLAAGSPFFARLPLARHGLAWVHPAAPCAHPLDDGTAAVCERSVGATADGLGADGAAWAALFAPLVRDWSALADDLLGPPLHWPRHPLALARFALAARRSALSLARARFRGAAARALFAGMAAHAVLPLEALPTAAYGLLLAVTAHAVGWPMPRGGAQRITDALVAHLGTLGGVVETGRRIDGLDGLPPDAPVVLDLTPREVLRVAAGRLPASYRRRLAGYRYGPGAFKLDWALDAPIPWRAAACARAGTVHLGGTLEEIAAAERAVAAGEVPERPFVLLAQQTLFDPTRAPAGRHTAWAYCHVPNGSTVDATPHIEAQVERFAPGFGARILGRHVTAPADLERRNANLVGGDFAGGRQDAWQIVARPRLLRPYATPDPRLFVCSAATPPGGGVHGMCGWHAARAVGPPS
jgi:phytoene dehydrogenase-like protein